jgi:hypothetical protein
MDDTLMVPLNVRRVLSRFDWRQPWYLGDMEDVEDAELVSGKGTFQVASGGCGWALSASALKLAVLNIAHFEAIRRTQTDDIALPMHQVC